MKSPTLEFFIKIRIELNKYFYENEMKEFEYYFKVITNNAKFKSFKTLKPIREQLIEQYNYIRDHEFVIMFDDYLNINCMNCNDCVMCVNCIECANCIRCKHCLKCDGCRNCTRCARCDECNECVMCKHCTNVYNRYDENGLCAKITAALIGVGILILLMSSPCLSCNSCCWSRLIF